MRGVWINFFLKFSPANFFVIGSAACFISPIRFKFFSQKYQEIIIDVPPAAAAPLHLTCFSKRVFTKSVGWYKPSQLKCDKHQFSWNFWQELKKGKLSENVFTPPLSLSWSPVCTVDWPVIVYLLSRPPPPSIIPPPPWRLVFDSKTTVLTPALSLLTLSRLSMNVSIFYFF